MIEAFKKIVKEAGGIIRHVEGNFGNVEEKPGTANFVTEYDLRVQRFLVEKLGERFPGYSFVCEEESFSGNAVAGKSFIIDPIDGTTNFLCGMLFSGVSVALTEDGETVMGAVYNPFREELFWAQKGKGAYLNDTPLQMIDRPLAAGVVNFSNAPYNPEDRQAAFALAQAVYPHTMDLRELGSASLSLCYTAAGRCVAYYSPGLCVWDYAAAELIVAEAGGVTLCAKDGSPTAYRTHIPIVAGTKQAVAEFLEIAGNCVRES